MGCGVIGVKPMYGTESFEPCALCFGESTGFNFDFFDGLVEREIAVEIFDNLFGAEGLRGLLAK